MSSRRSVRDGGAGRFRLYCVSVDIDCGRQRGLVQVRTAHGRPLDFPGKLL
jgi:hypothetical protein